jgi:hypothetical protein
MMMADEGGIAMSDNNDDVATNLMHGELVQFLTQNEAMKKTARGSLKQSLYAGGGAFAGCKYSTVII